MVNFDSGKDLLEKSSGPDMTPMIDMVFLLLIFFLLTSLIIRPVLEVELPGSETAEAKEPQQLLVEVTRDSAISFGGGTVSIDALEALLIGAMEETGISTVTIQADRRVEFDLIVELMDIARKARAESISFVVDRE